MHRWGKCCYEDECAALGPAEPKSIINNKSCPLSLCHVLGTLLKIVESSQQRCKRRAVIALTGEGTEPLRGPQSHGVEVTEVTELGPRPQLQPVYITFVLI